MGYINNNPATEKQLDCLKRFEIPFEEGITVTEAGKLIHASINGKPLPKKKTTTSATPKVVSKKEKSNLATEFAKFFNEKIVRDLKEIKKSLFTQTAITDDPTIYSGKRKKYVFVGYGCGFVFLRYSKRNKKAVEMEKVIKNYHDTACSVVMKLLDKELIVELEKSGNPFEALWLQDIKMKLVYYSIGKEFMESKGIKGVTYESFDD